MKDYIRDLKVCIKRLFDAERLLDRYTEDGDEAFVKCLDINTHPIKDYSKNEAECFIYICGLPLGIPMKPWIHDPKEIRAIIVKKRNNLRYIAGMVDKSRWLGKRNFLCKKSRQLKYQTGRLIG
jgi:hypothetical protein